MELILKDKSPAIKEVYLDDKIVGTFDCIEDGFWYYDPDEKTHRGYLRAFELRFIAEKLDELNEPWRKQINEYFDNLEQEESKNPPMNEGSLDDDLPF